MLVLPLKQMKTYQEMSLEQMKEWNMHNVFPKQVDLWWNSVVHFSKEVPSGCDRFATLFHFMDKHNKRDILQPGNFVAYAGLGSGGARTHAAARPPRACLSSA